MKLGAIFGTTFFSVIAALVIYDLVIKGAVSGLFGNKYDNTFDPSATGIEHLRAIANGSVKNNVRYLKDENGRIYKVSKYAA